MEVWWRFWCTTYFRKQLIIRIIQRNYILRVEDGGRNQKKCRGMNESTYPVIRRVEAVWKQPDLPPHVSSIY